MRPVFAVDLDAEVQLLNPKEDAIRRSEGKELGFKSS